MIRRAPSRAPALPPLADILVEGAIVAAEGLMAANGERVLDLVRTVAVRAKGAKKRPGPVVTPVILKDLTWHMRSYDQEVVLAVLLDKKDRLIGLYEHTKGGSSNAPVEPYHLLKMALLTGAPKLVMVHNHPTGRSVPSRDDHEMTIAVASLLAVYGVTLAGHFVVADDGMTELVLPYEGRETRFVAGAAENAPPSWVETVSLDAKGFTELAHDPYGPYRTYLVSSGLVRTQEPTSASLARMSFAGPEALQLLARLVTDLRGEHYEGVALLALDNVLRPTALELIDRRVDDLLWSSKQGEAVDLHRAGVLLCLMAGGRQYVLMVFCPGISKGSRGSESILSTLAEARRSLHREGGLVPLADILLASSTTVDSARMRRLI